mmetsp:Transcript_70960/g.219073  ORF Transcript_70960/g.219073 Transcript_70960/m.219073 type:complete len:278 (-) Transcript_70960:248-1081(-)
MSCVDDSPLRKRRSPHNPSPGARPASPAPHCQLSRLRSQPQLCHCVLACGKLRNHDAQCREHGEAAVVEFAVPHFLGVLAEPKRISEVARLLAPLPLCHVDPVLPKEQLQGTGECEDHDEAKTAGGLCQGAESRGQRLAKVGEREARKPHEVLCDGAERCHHGDASVLELAGPVLVEDGLVFGADAERIPEAQRLGHTNLLPGVEEPERLGLPRGRLRLRLGLALCLLLGVCHRGLLWRRLLWRRLLRGPAQCERPSRVGADERGARGHDASCAGKP